VFRNSAAIRTRGSADPGAFPGTLVLALALVVLVSTVAACSSSGNATTRLHRVGGDRADVVLSRSDARGEQVVHAVGAVAGRLRLAGVVFGVWDGDRELARGHVPGDATVAWAMLAKHPLP